MALPVTANDSLIKVNDLKSRPYIDMTLQVLEKFGIKVTNDNYSQFIIPGNQKYRAGRFDVESDWSGGAFLLVAGAIAGEVTVQGLRTDSRQSDKAILTALDKAGAKLNINEDSDHRFQVQPSKLLNLIRPNHPICFLLLLFWHHIVKESPG